MAFGNGPRLVTTGLDLLVDAADRQSYPGSGTSWRDLKSTITGSLTGSISYTTEFYGGLTFSDSSSAIIFPSTVASYGTGSFTIEMAFKPTFINGRHYLMSKNSGSFPNWSIYLSGSAGAGKLWSEFRISSTVSCSVSSSTTFVTGSVYQIDTRYYPIYSASAIYVNGLSEATSFGNGSGTLTSTASLFQGNYALNNSQNFSGSIYSTKIYSINTPLQPVFNYNATSTRFSKPPVSDTAKKQYEILIIAGGGAGGYSNGGGGGAGGLQYIITNNIPSSPTSVIVGNGGVSSADGQNSSFLTYTSIGGGAGGGESNTGGNGGSGGGAGYNNATTGSGTSGQGNNGGTRVNSNAQGGGGGAGSVGQSSTIVYIAGNGGSGSFIPNFSTIGGSPAGWFAGGGGGQVRYSSGGTAVPGVGGIGGGGNGGNEEGSSPTAGTTNTGGGGGGGRNNGQGGNGGSGIVAIRYSGGPIALGGEITQSAGYTYHVFRTTGTSSFTLF